MGPVAVKKTEGSESPPLRPLDRLRNGKMSLNAALLQQLRADLMSGRIAPGARLKIPELSQRYSVTPGAVREALSRLVTEGLVSFADQRGFRAAEVTLKELNDVTRVRIFVEREALREAMERGDDEWESEVLAAHHRLMRTARKVGDATAPESIEWTRRHREFHAALISACRSEWLLRLHNVLYDQSERYRLLSSEAGGGGRRDARGADDDHSRMVRAVLARNEELALDLIQKHIERTAERVRAAMKRGSDADAADGKPSQPF